MKASVSVIIPTFNRARLVCAAVDSALQQTHCPTEVIVVDDGSTDDTADRLAAYGSAIRVIRQSNAGVCAARNAGIAASTGDIVAFLDSDDRWLPWKLAAQAAVFTAVPEIQIVYSDARTIELDGRVRDERCLRRWHRAAYGYLPETELFERSVPVASLAGAPAEVPAGTQLRVGDFSSRIYLGNLFNLSTVAIRRRALERFGMFDPGVGNAGEDYELFSRLVQAGPVALIDTSTTECRVRGSDNLSTMRTHTTLANLETMRRIAASRGGQLRLPTAVLQSRQRDAERAAGHTLFDDDRPLDARPHLLRAVRLGSHDLRTIAYLGLSLLPLSAIAWVRRIHHAVKRATFARVGKTSGA